MVSVIFPAAGQGKRMHAGRNKVFLDLDGEPIVLRTLRRFSAVPEVDELIVVTGKDDLAAMEQLLAQAAGLKPWQVVVGGSERQYSVLNGLRAASPQADILLVHDAARPLVSVQTIGDVIRAARSAGAAIPAVPRTDTINVVPEAGIVQPTPARRTLWAVQTPQGFQRDILLKADAQAESDGFLGTDDASLVERLGVPVHVVTAGYENIKVTTPGDMLIAEAFLHTDQ